MDDHHIGVWVLDDKGDERGNSYSADLSWLRNEFPVRDVHIATIGPGHVRGNHYHVDRREILLVVHSDTWSVHWDTGPDSQVQQRIFTGAGAVLLYIPPLCSHALRNDGRTEFHMISLADDSYNPEAPDAIARQVVTS